MALARTNTQILRSDGGSATVAVNSPLTGNGSQELPLGLDENYHGADGESLTFNITDIDNGHTVTISGIQGSSSFNVMNGQNGADGTNGSDGADGQSVTFDITNIASGHRVTLSGVQGSASFDVMNGDNGVDGVSPTFRFSEDANGVTVYVSGAQGEDSFRLYNGTSGNTYSAGPNIDIYPVEDQLYISGKDWTNTIESAVSSKMDKSESGNFYPMVGNPSGFLTAHQDISDLMPKSESANFYPMTGNPSGFLTAHQDLTNLDYVQNSAIGYTPSMYISSISGHELYAESANHAFTAETANYVEGGWEYDENNNISSYNGSAFVGQGGGGVDPTALSGYIHKSAAQTDEANVHYSYLTRGDAWLKDTLSVYNEVYTETTSFDTTWHNYTVDLSNTHMSTACPIMISITSDVTANAISLTAADNSYNPVIEPANLIALPTDSTKLVFTASIKNSDIRNNIMSIAKLQIAQPTGGSDFTISITGSNNDVLATRNYVDNAVSTAGKTYTGVAPIVVNNTQDKISANCIELSAGNGIDSDKLALGVIEVSAQGGAGGVAISGQYNINDETVTKDCSAFGMFEQAFSPGSYQLIATAKNDIWHSYGYTMSNSESVLMSNVSSVAQNYAASAVSSHVVPMAYADITYSAVRDIIFNNGIVIPYETTQGYGTYYDFVASAVADSTSSFKFRHVQTNGYCTTLTVSSYNYGATTGKVKNQSRIFLSPAECECKVVLVATSGDIPASGATDGKLYVVTGSGT